VGPNLDELGPEERGQIEVLFANLTLDPDEEVKVSAPASSSS